jgi:hypothetical protein
MFFGANLRGEALVCLIRCHLGLSRRRMILLFGMPKPSIKSRPMLPNGAIICAVRAFPRECAAFALLAGSGKLHGGGALLRWL